MMRFCFLFFLLQQVPFGSSIISDHATVLRKENSEQDDKKGNEPDRVLTIPGYSGEDICWSHYAGYLDGIDDHQLFYWYHEAVSDPEEKPLVLWLNGGPGCSSLGGMFTELGPFVVDASMKITLNPYSFNKVANILFIEQPVGVGFSYPAGIPANDASTAIDTVVALRHFLDEKHPELRGRPFYVMGESYGGHYVPNTVKEIQETNDQFQREDDEHRINIQGFAVGNGYTDWHHDFNANVENGRYHALASEAQFEHAKNACKGDYARCFWPRPDVDCPQECSDAVYDTTINAMDGSIDIYDIYNDVCLLDDQERSETQLTTLLGFRRRAQLQQQKQQSAARLEAKNARRALRAVISPVFPTCIDAMSARYLNLPEVQEAINVKQGKVPQWYDCGPNLQYDFNYESEISNYQEWVATGKLKILIYNGDADYILSHMGNAAWINKGLQLSIAQSWKKWLGSDGQVAGYFEKYNTTGIPLTFLTVKGAGHMVPRDRPRHALDFFSKFIASDDGEYDKVKRSSNVEPLCPYDSRT